ncbi:MAG: DUF2147 domain-containing protein [Saprospiraceae bacterium]|nr:MAG: signal peptide protein [Bacteroidetes bacterium OLB9]MCO6463576.1 DUF2147 domain-containing protein [Saprospiraceae bacterium]MCZ2339617.1 DUF2147 domain-containing protein [Chitinophagales bacterium]
MNRTFIALIFIFNFVFASSGQSPLGIWKTVDDESGKEKSYVEIFEKNGKLYGKVVKLLEGATTDVCTACKGTKKGKKLVGMEILWDLSKSGKVWDDGTIMDPKNGKEYSCKIELEGQDKLKVRGYLGFSLLGRTQTWFRVK